MAMQPRQRDRCRAQLAKSSPLSISPLSGYAQYAVFYLFSVNLERWSRVSQVAESIAVLVLTLLHLVRLELRV